MRSFFAAVAVVCAVVAGTFEQAAAQPAFPPPPQELGPLGPPPGPPAGYVVEPGHWRWNGNRYIWVNRHWMLARMGYERFIPGHWSPRGRWIEAHWGR